MNNPPNILVCRCARAGRVPAEIARAVGRCEADVTTVADLCQLVAEKDPQLAEQAARKNLIVVACHPRAVRWLFESASAGLAADARLVDATAAATDDVLAQLPPQTSGVESADPETTGGWDAWFPVIDYDRCTHCGQCMNFCLFGVFARDGAGRISVRQPRNCKLLCPACARVCPQAAIIFPKHPDASIHGGPRAEGQLDTRALLEGDVYEALRNRSLGPGELQQALAEQRACGGDCGCDCESAPESDCNCDRECDDNGCCQ